MWHAGGGGTLSADCETSFWRSKALLGKGHETVEKILACCQILDVSRTYVVEEKIGEVRISESRNFGISLSR